MSRLWKDEFDSVGQDVRSQLPLSRSLSDIGLSDCRLGRFCRGGNGALSVLHRSAQIDDLKEENRSLDQSGNDGSNANAPRPSFIDLVLLHVGSMFGGLFLGGWAALQFDEEGCSLRALLLFVSGSALMIAGSVALYLGLSVTRAARERPC